MPDRELTLDDVRKMAAEIGMTRLTEEHLQQLLRATNAARARRTTLEGMALGLADEPAHVFSLAPDPGAGSRSGAPSSLSLLPGGEGNRLLSE